MSINGSGPGSGAHAGFLEGAAAAYRHSRTLEPLLSYAKNRDALHLPAWKAFNRSVGSSGDVGVWHETYSVPVDGYENIYVNMPPFGLGKFGTLTPATGALQTAEGRLRAGDRRAS